MSAQKPVEEPSVPSDFTPPQEQVIANTSLGAAASENEGAWTTQERTRTPRIVIQPTTTSTDAAHTSTTTTTKEPSIQTHHAGKQQSTFAPLHSKICEIIEHWATTKASKNSKFYQVYTKQWKDKIKGNSNFYTVKRHLKIESLINYLQVVQQCTDVKAKINMHYDPRKACIIYDMRAPMQTRSQTAMGIIEAEPVTSFASVDEIAASDSKPSSTIVTPAKVIDFTKFHQAYTDITTFTPFQECVYSVMKSWTEEETSITHPFYANWNQWSHRIDETSPFYCVRKVTDITSLHQYFNLLMQCPAILEHLYIHWDDERQCIQWRMRPSLPKNPYKRSPLPQILERPGNETPSDISEAIVVAPTYLQQPSQLTDTSPPNMSGNVHRLVDLPSQPEPSVDHIREAESYLRPSTIPPLSDANLASLRLDIESEPMEGAASGQINRFLHFFQDTYNAQMGKLGTYVNRAKMEIASEVATTTARLNAVQEELDNFNEIFDTAISQAHDRMQDLDSRVQYFHWNMDQRASDASSRVAQLCGHYEHNLKTAANSARASFKEDIQADLDVAVRVAVAEYIEPLLADQMHKLQEQGEEALQNLESAYTEMLEELMNTSQTRAATSAPAPGATTWHGHTVNLAPLQSHASHTTTRRVNEHPQASTNLKHSQDHRPVTGKSVQRNRWGLRLADNGPDHSEAQDSGDLPTLNHRDFITKVKLRYSNGKMFTFYNKLRNVGLQYGVYLLAVDQIQYDRSLCPGEYDGIPITDDRYYKMAATMYEKLSDSECIPDRCHQLRNVIDRYVDANDGYQVLYEFMEDHHPAMKRDPIISAPKSLDCGEDIQEYSAQFQTFITIEKLNGRGYSEREQVLHFLRGLGEEFQPAVQYVNTLMDAWGQTGLNPKCDMRVLPRTISDYLSTNGTGQIQSTGAIIRAAHGAPQDHHAPEETSQLDALTQLLKQHMDQSEAIIRAYRGGPKAPAGQTKTINAPAATGTATRKFMDVYCGACGGYGHPDKQCDFVARMIKSLDFIAAMDNTKRKDILEEFSTEQRRRRDSKQTSLAGKARVCRDANDVEGLYKLLVHGDPDNASDIEAE